MGLARVFLVSSRSSLAAAAAAAASARGHDRFGALGGCLEHLVSVRDELGQRVALLVVKVEQLLGLRQHERLGKQAIGKECQGISQSASQSAMSSFNLCRYCPRSISSFRPSAFLPFSPSGFWSVFIQYHFRIFLFPDQGLAFAGSGRDFQFLSPCSFPR